MIKNILVSENMKLGNSIIQRSECLYNGEIVGIESIYTVINGKQINISEKVEALREKGRKGLLQCPCGCGTKLILVAGDRGLRQQHFRARNGESWSECTLKEEGINSINSKIVIKCWLADKINQNVETRVPISRIADTDRKFEVSHYMPSIRFAVNYTNLRTNLEDDKLETLDQTLENKVLYIVDIDNLETFGQYPEYMNKIQKRQNYCLFLEIDGSKYEQAKLLSAFYEKNIDGFYQRIDMTKGFLKDYSFSDELHLLYKGDDLNDVYEEKRQQFIKTQEDRKKTRTEKELLRIEEKKNHEIEQKKRFEEHQRKEALFQKRREEIEQESIRKEEEKKNYVLQCCKNDPEMKQMSDMLSILARSDDFRAFANLAEKWQKRYGFVWLRSEFYH